MVSWTTLYLVSEWVIRLTMLFYIPQRRSPAATRTWLLLVFFLPWAGLVLYTLFGRIRYPQRRLVRKENLSLPATLRTPSGPAVPALDSWAIRIAALTQALGYFPACGGNRVEIYPGYDRALERLLADVAAAKHHVHLLYYIFEDDTVGERMTQALLAASQRGVRCRVLMDAVGSKRALKRLAPRLRVGGVEVLALLRVGFFRRSAARFDLRNHRKLAVIDGLTGYVGSQNIVAGQFLRDCPNEELVVRTSGPVVAQMQAVFLADRALETSDPIAHDGLFMPPLATGASAAQLLPSGPGYIQENSETLMVSLIHEARKRVVITTPYFVPDERFLHALQTAVLRGVEVLLILSARSNQRVTNLAQESYYDQLLSSGIRIHRYEGRLLHAKHLTLDDEIAVIGSTNIDIRSFALNTELSLLVYDAEVVAQLARVQADYLTHSRALELEQWRQRPTPLKVLQSSARLADSLL